MWLLLAASALVVAPAASAVEVAWRTVGNPGNSCTNSDPYGCIGGVPYVYEISKFEVTNAQYTAFLNSVAAADTFLLYNTLMTTEVQGGITRSGSPGSYSYATKPGSDQHPVNYVSYFDALRFANWLNNGQPIGAQNAATTEGGSYTFVNSTTVGARNPGATIVLTNESEWYKAAYYDAIVNQFFAQATGTNGIICSAPSSNPIGGNCGNAVGGLTDVGSYPNALSPYGTADQGGNVAEWIERVAPVSAFIRGGSYATDVNSTSKYLRDTFPSGNAVGSYFGFRVAQIPEPDTGLLLMAGLLALAYRQRQRGRAADARTVRQRLAPKL